MINYNILSSGSNGNATIINDNILIDCGVPFKKIKGYHKKIQLVLLTHIHSDHFNKTTLKNLALERPTVRFGCGKWLVNDLLVLGINKANIDVYDMDKTYNYGSFKIIPFFLKHNVENCGYKIHFNNFKLFYATDCNNLNGIEAKNYDLYMVEANYTEKGIKERIKQKELNGEYVYEYNSLKNHLSKEKADDFIYSNIGYNSQFIYMHINKEECYE
ncbi:MBL fold metallo-hydrolase [[Clostridium] colinum]|uniref:MBL fold metallo-hydrolase n=1 Tax=[Clostridium] colinum TaxID=36835 RepID=UPI0020253CA3|nr:MBL fold metallo-hydrolase [[Clostridium] colinum]